MSFYSERTIKAIRKARPCYGCGVKLEIGESALGCAGHYDGEFWAAAYHAECRKAETGLNDLHDIRHGDEWMGLGDLEWDDWPWLIEEFPAVAERMKITTERFNEVAEEWNRRWRPKPAQP